MKSCVVAILGFFFVSFATFSVAAQDEEETDEEVIEEVAPEDFEDIRALQELESEALKPKVYTESASLELFAPSAGALHRIQSDHGLVPELTTRRVPRGAELLGVPGVAERFSHSPVLGLTKHQDPSIKAYLDFFDGRGKPILARWISRMGRYQPMILAKLKAAGLPEDLIFVAMIESGFSPRATSPAAAVGVWQFIPTTGSEMGLRIDRWVDERRDPEKATDAAIAYLTRLYERFGSWPLALAAYNGGPGLVGNTVKKYNSNDYWHIQRSGGMYDETRRYVPKVLAAGLVTKNADIFGLSHVTMVEPWEFDTVKVPGGTRLSLFADASGTDVKTLRELNPELLAAQTPPGAEYTLRIPKGSTPKFVENYDKIKVRGDVAHEIYTTMFGETLDDVAEKFAVAPRVIRAINGLASRERVPYGTELLIPKEGRGSWKGKRSRTPTLVVPKAIKVSGLERFYYEVNAGDTLSTISAGLGVRESDILVWNFLDPAAKLQPGMVLQVFLKKRPELARVMNDDDVKAVVEGSTEHKKLTTRSKPRVFRHRVKQGESLWTIARKYKVTVNDLKKWNRSLRRSNLLQPGQRIIVYPRRR